MSMMGIRSKSVGSSLPNEEKAAIFLCMSSTSPAAHSVNSWTNSVLAPAHQRSAVSRILDDRGIKFDSEQPARTRDDEQCFERIMWSVKEITSDFLTACYDEQDNRCQLSENWFQQDSRHYDLQQKKNVTKIFESNHRRRILQLQEGEGRRVRPKMTAHRSHGLGLPLLKKCILEYLSVPTEQATQTAPKCSCPAALVLSLGRPDHHLSLQKNDKSLSLGP